MPDRGPPAPQPLLVIPLVVSSVPSEELPVPPAQLIVPPTQPNQPAPMPQLNWSHFKPEFTGKPDEDMEAHLLRTSAFLEGVKVQKFCLPLVGEARLWSESFRPMALDWNGLQNHFRQQYSKIGNTREQLFHTWRSFHFDESTEM